LTTEDLISYVCIQYRWTMLLLVAIDHILHRDALFSSHLSAIYVLYTTLSCVSVAPVVSQRTDNI